MKLTEDEVVLSLLQYLESKKWEITSHCLGMERGNDIVAKKGAEMLIVEAKGARANSKAPQKKRDKFDSGQIKTHFGKAIVKIFDEKLKNPNASFAIAHPDDEDIPLFGMFGSAASRSIDKKGSLNPLFEGFAFATPMFFKCLAFYVVTTALII